ncbi:MAG: recombinase family protein [Holosporaceae bacterium]|jgi:site-specific DNA recombinase|nr:recombinase family protein [Holosporaceae bacterium]
MAKIKQQNKAVDQSSDNRCVIYTRKSVEDDYRKEITSLEAQRINCEKYIESQAVKGWKIIEKLYEDYGKTGANIDRPGFQELLTDVRAGKIDRVVVYKLDRLTRSLRDFVNIIDGTFKEHDVSFVSATESFDTSTPTGKLILNILLIFAEFEREQTSLRVKDKIHVSRTNGVWTGGNIPIGYKSMERKLVVDEKFAQLMRFMFARFMELRSPEALAQEMNAKVLAEYSEEDRSTLGEFHRKRMYKLLSNPIYKGYIAHHGKHYKGQHDALVDEELWNQAQEILAGAGQAPKAALDLEFALKSRVRCQECDKAMVVCKTYKKTRKYAYYTCLNKHNGLHCKGLDINVNAELVHNLVTAEVRKILNEPESLGGLWEKLAADSSPTDAYEKLQNLDKAWDLLQPAEHNKILQEFVKTVWLSKNGLTIEFTPDGVGVEPQLLGTNKIVKIPGTFYNLKNKPQVFVPKDDDDGHNDPTLLKALIRAEVWRKEVLSGELSSYAEIAEKYKLDEQFVRKNFVFAFLSPKIKEAILFGKLSPAWNLLDFNGRRPPQNWAEQEAKFLE